MKRLPGKGPNLVLSTDQIFNELLRNQGYQAELYQNKLDSIIGALNAREQNNPILLYKVAICQALINFYLEDYDYASKNITNALNIVHQNDMESLYSDTMNSIIDSINQRNIDYAEEQRIRSAKDAFVGSLLYAIGLFVVGGIVTGITYALADEGGTYYITSGLFLIGGVYFLLSIYRFFVWLFYLITK